jgi:hypothetical protein
MTIDGQTIDQRALRNAKYISIIIEIAAGGESLNRYIAISQYHKPLRKGLMGEAVRLGVALIMSK